MKFSPEEIKQRLELGYEQSGIEFKPPFSFKDKEMLAKIVRAMLAMANRQDGGTIIIGVEEKDKHLTLSGGLSEEQLQTLNYDDFSSYVNSYADPNVEFECCTVEIDSNKLLVIDVKEFAEIPVLCKKQFTDILRPGACYVRPKRKPESIEIPTQTEMRELLNLAKIKSLRKFVTEARTANIELVAENMKSADELFKMQLDRAVELKINGDEINTKIRSRGHWVVHIRPVDFQETRVPNINALFSILQNYRVELLGWDYPHYDYNSSPSIGENWITSASQFQHYLEEWILLQSGYFYDLRCIPSDWQDISQFWPADQSWKPGTRLGIVNTLTTLREIFEFASRLSMTELGAENMFIKIDLNRIKGRCIHIDTYNRTPFSRAYKASIDSYQIFSGEIARKDLITRSTEIALQSASDLFNRFGWETTAGYLNEYWLKETRR